MLIPGIRITGRGFMFAGDGAGWLASPGWFSVAGFVIGIGLWLLLARSTIVRGGNMERPERVPQLYGYTVCLIAIVVMLASLDTMVDKAFILADPIATSSPFGWGDAPSLTSFEAYKATRDRALALPSMMDGEKVQRPELTEPELRARYDALRADRIKNARHDAQRALTGSGLLFLLAAALFWWHWRWVRGAEVRAFAAGAVARE